MVPLYRPRAVQTRRIGRTEVLFVGDDIHFARLVSENGVTFARGTRVEMEFDEEGNLYPVAAATASVH